jgi:hypothetical protein
VRWLAVDVRPAIALLIGLEWLLGPTAAFAAVRGTWLPGSYYTALGVPLAAGGVILAIKTPSPETSPMTDATATSTTVSIEGTLGARPVAARQGLANVPEPAVMRWSCGAGAH